MKIEEYFQTAFEFFNDQLFANELEPAVITLRANPKRQNGYFRERGFGSIDLKEDETIPEIALQLQRKEDNLGILSTLIHEMTHHQQAQREREGNARTGKNGYHNKEWCQLMLDIGLTPINNKGAVGLKATGTKVSHIIDKDGDAESVMKAFIDQHGPVPLWEPARFQKPNVVIKVKYVCGCPDPGRGKASRDKQPNKFWGAPGIFATCQICGLEFEPQ